ncbi:MAG: hypothetical protein WCO06_06615 [Candidatus Roizmanbacteria bacterium]
MISQFKSFLNKHSLVLVYSFLLSTFVLTPFQLVYAQETIEISEKAINFRIPNFSEVLTFVIKTFFVIAGVTALFFMLLGALAWVTSSGSKEAVDKARDKIQAAVVGVILIVVVLSLIVTLEQVVFKGKVCFGISCAVTIPELLQAPTK